MESWAELELAPWQGRSFDVEQTEAALRAYAASQLTIYIFEIDGHDVRLDDKGIPTGEADPTFGYHSALVSRGRTYERFFSEVLRVYGIGGKAIFALDLTDLRSIRADLPIFAFQRRRFEAVPLMPDIEMIEYEWHIRDDLVDHIAFEDKQPEAIFVGSTTGDPILTTDIVAKNQSARIRSARFFKDREGVTFDLPKIVQHDTPETLALIQSLGIEGRLRGWNEQTPFRYLISMDGNGAACSRPYLALAGNGILLKYNSPHELFYFRGMRPWMEFIPIREDQDVLAIVAGASTSFELHREIARRSRKFASENLSRIHTMEYTAELLQRYIEQFGRHSLRPLANGLDRSFAIDAHVHAAQIGSIWPRVGDWTGRDGTPIESFTLVAGAGLKPSDLSYAAIAGDGSILPASQENGSCGTRGIGQPLHGLTIDLSAAGQRRFRLSYQARFADGFESRWATSGTKLWRKQSPMTGFRIQTTPR